MTYKDSFDNDTLTIYLSGRITAENAGELEDCVMNSLEEHHPSHVIFDFDEAEYISSAGLRLIMKIAKMGINVRLINVDEEVYNVLDMTGFTEFTEICRK